jgi:hypothetical protein
LHNIDKTTCCVCNGNWRTCTSVNGLPMVAFCVLMETASSLTFTVSVTCPNSRATFSVAGVLIGHAFCSTAGQLHLTLQNAGTTITGSTMSAYAMFHDWNIPA